MFFKKKKVEHTKMQERSSVSKKKVYANEPAASYCVACGAPISAEGSMICWACLQETKQ